MQKSKGQVHIEKLKPFGAKGPYTVEKRRILRLGNSDPSLKVGDIVTVNYWGSFGCWDIENRWVDFYQTEQVGIIRNWNE